ncbi:MAG: hypothetical protein O3B47_00320 [bacterium]|nr:hypothetical protein [bacterium]
MNKFSYKFLITILLLFLSTSSVYAASSGGNLSVGGCIKKGGLDFALFWDSVIYNDDLMEGIVEPWRDITSRNQCHSFDVIGLVKQQDQVRKKIRGAFLTCNTQKLPDLKKAFHKISIEIYYVRHIVDGSVVLNLPYDLLQHQFFKKEPVRDMIYNKMKNKYVSAEFLSQEDFDQLFLLLESKYSERKKAYRDKCENGSWKAVAEKWDEFKEHFANGMGASEFADEVVASAKIIATTGNKLGITKLIKGEMSLAAYAKSFVTANLNGVEFTEGLGDIADAFSKNAPSTRTTPTIGEVAGNFSISEESFNSEEVKKTMMADFTTLYSNLSDETVENFVNTLSDNSTPSPKSDGFIEIIKNTYPQLNKIEQGVKMMRDRQCPG